MANDKEIRAIIAGSRNFVDYNLLEKECDTILSCLTKRSNDYRQKRKLSKTT